MSPARRACVVALMLAVLAPAGARASVVTAMGTEALVDLSTVIVRGEVVDVRSGPDGRGVLYTWVTLRVDESLRGGEGRARITVQVPGGAWRGRVSRVLGAPSFTPEERVVVFARPGSDGQLAVTGLFQGKLRIVEEEGAAYVVQDPGAEARVVRRGDDPPAPLRQPLDRLLDDIRARVALDAGPAPGSAAQAGAAPHAPGEAPSFTLLNPLLPFRWFEPDSGAPVSLMFNVNGAPVSAPDAVAGFGAALGHWTDVTGSTLAMVDGGDTAQACRLFFDGSVISHGDPCDQIPDFDAITCSGVLAITGISGFTLESRTVNGVSFLRMTEADIVFNADTECFYAGADSALNYEEVLSHEMGHVAGLGHSCGDSFSPACTPGSELDDALMRAFAHGGGRGGAPRADDVDGVRFVYPPAGFVDAFLNQETFSASETLTLRADLNGTATIDFYLLLVLPDGNFVSIAPGLPVNAVVPAATGVPLVFAPDLELFSHTFTGDEAGGTYTWVVLLVAAGADPTDSANLRGFDVESFALVP